jgi:oligopeptide/dipeptide ABC transporter ATP-binding protein
MLKVTNLSTSFSVENATLKAVDSISFHIEDGEVVGLVGESGSGKSITALSLMGLLPENGSITSGSIEYKNQDLTKLPQDTLRKIRGKEIGLIFQNALSALNPVFTIGNQMIETIMIHHNTTKEKAKDMALSWLKEVGISDPERRLEQYPHECSLGMCQRIMIALTLSMNPSLLIADEPTASLDVTIQAQILELLKSLKKEYNMSVLMVSHDMGVIAQHCDRVMVMYCGKIVESGKTEDIFASPKHPYTQALLSSIPVADPSAKQTPTLLSGDIPSPMNLPSGCRFHPRCPQVKPECKTSAPPSHTVGSQTYECVITQTNVSSSTSQND